MTLRLNSDQTLQAADILKQGGTVAFPTETVYGLGADATNASAIGAIFTAKGRPSDNPLIIHLGHPDQLSDYCQEIPSLAYRLIDFFCPGPLTLVLPKKSSIVECVTAGLNTVAVRFPSHPTAHKILMAAALPIAAPSANRSGRPSATTWQAVLEDLDGRIDAVMCEGVSDIGLESTVLDLSSAEPTVLRHGAITLEQLQKIEPLIRVRSEADDAFANSPGLRHRHYQPHAKVVLCDSPNQIAEIRSKKIPPALAPFSERIAFIGLTEAHPGLSLWLCMQCRNIDEYARNLFDFFRQCDSAKIDQIYCQRVEAVGLGRAIMDRLRRASEAS